MCAVIRRVEPDDGARLKNVRLAALRDAPFAFGSSYELEADRSDDEWTERATLGSEGPHRATFLAFDGTEVVGLVGVHRSEGDVAEAELVSMWTAPQARRRGLGRDLVQAATVWARAGGVELVALWVTRGNEPAQALYESVGFTSTGDYQPLPSDPCKDETRMVLRLETT